MRWLDAAVAVLTVLYPAAVYFGLRSLEPRVIGLLLVAILLLRHLRQFRSILDSLHRSDWIAGAAIALLSISIVVFNNVTLLLLYPACVSSLLLFTFARTLFYPPSMIERFARLSCPELPLAGIQYTRRVTAVWCLFFILNGSVAAASAFSTREWWLLYNGLISYLLMGALYLGEWLVRRQVMTKDTSVA